MASKLTQFKNDKGVKEITIGVREFECIGASAPYDHPHIFLDMNSRPISFAPIALQFINTTLLSRPLKLFLKGALWKLRASGSGEIP